MRELGKGFLPTNHHLQYSLPFFSFFFYLESNAGLFSRLPELTEEKHIDSTMNTV